MEFKRNDSSKKYDVIRPTFDTIFKISVPFFVQIKIPCYSLRKMIGRFPSGEEAAPSFRFLGAFTSFSLKRTAEEWD